MSHTNAIRPFGESLSNCNRCVASRLGMTVRTYKIIKALTQLLAVAAGIYAISQGADATLVFVGVAGIVSGPELVEALVAEGAIGTQESTGED